MKHNPPLTALRAFAVAARHQSFAKAGDDMAVTAAAVSQQVKKLEEYLGVSLFRRLPQRLELTSAGAALLPAIESVFGQLDEVIGRFRRTDNDRKLTLSVAPVFASKWLVPRLVQFHEQFPSVDVRISSRLELVDFQREDIDAAIRLGRHLSTDLTGEILFSECLTPLCAPHLLTGPNAIKTPGDLVKHVLLHDDSLHMDPQVPVWQTWLSAAGVAGVDTQRGPHFSHPDHMFQAAIDGAGVMLGWRNLAADDLTTGRLVQPFPLTLSMGLAFRFVYPAAHTQRKTIQLFQDWLLDQVSHSQLLEPNKDD